MRIIWKQWGQQRFSYNSNIRVVTEFWFRFVFFCFFDRFWSLLLTYSREFLRRLITNRQRKSCRTIRLLSTLYYCKRLAILYIQSDMRERFYNSDEFHLHTVNQAETTWRLASSWAWNKHQNSLFSIHEIFQTLCKHAPLTSGSFSTSSLDMSRTASCWDACSLW